MNELLKKFTENKLILFSLLFLSACIFYMYNLQFSDLWSDEIYTKSMLSGSFSEFFAKYINDLHPPLYYIGLRLFTFLFGLTPLTLRLFSVLGVLSIVLLGYFTGQRIFGKQGALYFCLMLVSVPMLAAFSHQARMYTWAAFSVTGVFLYAALFMKTGKNRDLVFLLIFTVIAMYIHYYSMVAALVANAFVFLYLLSTKNRKWRRHLISIILAVLFFLPWVFMFVVQVKRVQHAFWAPEVTMSGILSCFTIPFTEQFWTSDYSTALTILMYILIAIALIMSFNKRWSEDRLVLWLSMSVFLGTLLVVTLLSLFSQPILYSRYVMAIVTMLVIPLTVLLIRMNLKWLKWLLIIVIVWLGMRTSISHFGFSYGPYKQTIEYISSSYPNIKKILHISEITAGPLSEYNGISELSHYWLKAEMSNVDLFTEVKQFNQPGEFLQPGEEFCAVRFNNLVLNLENLDRVMAESELMKKDTVKDNKLQYGLFIELYLLRYRGKDK